MGDDILRMAMEINGRGKKMGILNSTFIALIPKFEHIDSFGDFRPIPLYTMLYNIVSRVFSLRIKPLLSSYIYEENFGFLNKRNIHEFVGSAQEAFHSIKTNDLSAFVLKINLEKAYDKLTWTFLQLLLLHIGFYINQLNRL